MPRKIIRHTDQGAIFREADLSYLADPANVDMMHSAFDHVWEHLMDPMTPMHGQDAAETWENVKDNYHNVKTQWGNAAAGWAQNHMREHGRPPSIQQLTQNAHQFLKDNPGAVSSYVMASMNYLDDLGSDPTRKQRGWAGYGSPVPGQETKSQKPIKETPDDYAGSYDMWNADESGTPMYRDPELYSDPDYRSWHKYVGENPWRGVMASGRHAARYILLPHWDPQKSVEIMHDHAADMGTRTAAPQVTPDLINLAHQGGFTLHDHVGDAPTSGYMVSTHKSTEQMRPLAQLRPEHISDYVRDHTRELSAPNSYLGGWLDGKNFYLDVSNHRPTLDRAAHDAAMNNQLAIYDLGRGQAINTPDAVMQSGDPGLAYHDKPKNPLLAFALPHPDPDHDYWEDLPDHDWTQHTLGDAEHWGEEDPPMRHVDAAIGPPKLPSLEYYQPAPGSSHSAELWREPGTTTNWLVKHAPPGAEFLADGDVAANQIAAASGVDTPAIFKTDLGKGPASAQQMIPGAKDAFPNQDGIDPEKLSDDDLLTIQKHHALDWMIGNHDSHERQFIRDPSGKLIGIDKAQAFKYFNHDQLNWNFHPNSMYNEHEPIYNTIYRNMAKGGRVVNDPRDGELGKYIQGLSAIPDDEYRAMLTPYAQGAAKAGMLGKQFTPNQHQGFVPTPRFKANDPESFLDAAVARKNSLSDDMGRLFDSATAHAATGTKIARRRYSMAPDMHTLQQMGQQLGSHGAEVFSDRQGQWLIKRPPRGADFMVPLDTATAALQHRAGLEVPETHAIPWHRGRHVSAIQMIPGAQQAWEQSPNLAELHPKDVMTLQKHQVLDWLIGNHDGHVGNFMRTPQGGLVGIDKGQAFKYFGRDRLDPNFHPNFYAREPIYNNLWRDFSDGKGTMNDPRKGELGAFVSHLQDIPDEDLKNMFRPYAESASHVGLLGNVKDDDPRRQLGEPTLAPNDPEAFLGAMARRKNSLDKDLGALYDGQVSGRNLTKQIQHDNPNAPLDSFTVKAKVQ